VLHFDTNALIALPHWAREEHPAVARVLAGEAVAVSALVWYEFLSGPLAETEAGLARAFLQGQILPVGEEDAELFNAVGRKRTLKADALIAAMAIRAKAEFFTLNGAGFEPFVSQGLRLFPLPA
jgi:predicted nucleic acid-binding protein